MKINGFRIKSNPEYSKTYNLWRHMMDRCYKKSDKDYKVYGGSGCYVCDKWHNYNGFLEDVDKIDGFVYTEFITGKLSLDKDKKVRNNKEYCIDKCSFISASENNKYKPTQQREVLGTDPEGHEHVFFNQSEFARLNGLRQSCIGDCLSGKCKTHKGWTFSYKNSRDSK